MLFAAVGLKINKIYPVQADAPWSTGRCTAVAHSPAASLWGVIKVVLCMQTHPEAQADVA